MLLNISQYYYFLSPGICLKNHKDVRAGPSTSQIVISSVAWALVKASYHGIFCQALMFFAF